MKVTTIIILFVAVVMFLKVCDVLDQVPCTHPDIASDYLVDEAEIMYWGYCKECAKTLAE